MQLSKNSFKSYLGIHGALILHSRSTVTQRLMVGLTGLEPVTPALSRRCSNQLSYRPAIQKVRWWR